MMYSGQWKRRAHSQGRKQEETNKRRTRRRVRVRTWSTAECFCKCKQGQAVKRLIGGAQKAVARARRETHAWRASHQLGQRANQRRSNPNWRAGQAEHHRKRRGPRLWWWSSIMISPAALFAPLVSFLSTWRCARLLLFKTLSYSDNKDNFNLCNARTDLSFCLYLFFLNVFSNRWRVFLCCNIGNATTIQVMLQLAALPRWRSGLARKAESSMFADLSFRHSLGWIRTQKIVTDVARRSALVYPELAAPWAFSAACLLLALSASLSTASSTTPWPPCGERVWEAVRSYICHFHGIFWR